MREVRVSPIFGCSVGLAVACLALVRCASFDVAAVAEPAVEAGSPDADASGGDGSDLTPTEAGAEAGIFGGCPLELSDDFERAMVDDARWDGPYGKTGGATLTIDNAVFLHGIAGLRADAPANAATAFLFKGLGMRSRVRYAFAAKTPAALSARAISLGTIELDVGGLHHLALYIATQNGNVQLREQRLDVAPSTVLPHFLAPDTGGWHTYTITLDLVAGAPHALVQVDSKTAFDGLLTYAFVPATASIHAGLGNADPGPAATLWFDDVAVCSEP